MSKILNSWQGLNLELSIRFLFYCCRMEAQDLDLLHPQFPSHMNLLFHHMYTANVCRDLQGLCGGIRVRGFQIYGDYMYTAIPVIFEVNKKKVWTFYIP